MPNPKDGKLELLSDKNSVLVLVDYQPAMFAGVASGDKTIIRNAATCAAKAASILGVPVVLSAIGPQRNGEFMADVTKIFPGQEVFARAVPGFDAFEDEKTWNAFKKTGRKKVVISGLWTSMCFAYTALHALKEGYEVYGLVDAAGIRHGRPQVRDREDAAGRSHSHHDRVAGLGMDARLGQPEVDGPDKRGVFEIRLHDWVPVKNEPGERGGHL